MKFVLCIFCNITKILVYANMRSYKIHGKQKEIVWVSWFNRSRPWNKCSSYLTSMIITVDDFQKV